MPAKYKISKSFKDPRWNSVITNMAGSAVSKIVGFFVGFAILPLAIGYLSSEEYGIWITITSLGTLLQLMDFGVGNALISKVNEDKNDKGLSSIKGLLMTSLLTTLIFGMALLLFVVITFHYIKYAEIFNLKTEESAKTFEESFVVFSIISMINISMAIAQPIRLGLQQGYKNAPFNLLGYIANLLLVAAAIRMKCNLVILIGASCAGSLIFNFLNLMALLKTLPGRIKWDADYRINLMGSSVKYFILQLVGLIGYNISNLLIAHFYDYSRVAEYGLALKVFSIPSMILNMMFSGLWSAYANAKINKEWGWIVNVYRKTLARSTYLAVVISILLYLKLNTIAGLLSNGLIHISNAVGIGMLIWGCLAGVGGSVASLLNGLNELNEQVRISIASCAMNFMISLIIIREISYSGPIWGASAAAIITYPLLMRVANRVLKYN